MDRERLLLKRPEAGIWGFFGDKAWSARGRDLLLAARVERRARVKDVKLEARKTPRVQLEP